MRHNAAVFQQLLTDHLYETLLRTTGSVYQCCEYHQKLDSHQPLHLVRFSPQPGALHFNGVKGSEFLSDALTVLHWHAGSSLVHIVSCPDYFSHAEGKNSVVNRLSNFFSVRFKKGRLSFHPIPCGTALFGHVTYDATYTAYDRASHSRSHSLVSCLYVSFTVDLG